MNRPEQRLKVLPPLIVWLALLASLLSTSAQEACAGRLVEHAMGTTCVPETPQRVVVLDTGELDSALALGVKPVGATTVFADSGFLSYLDTEGVTPVGTVAEPNLEAILALQPDLILSSRLRHEALFDQLSKVAPTVFTETVGVVWKENFLKHGEALGREEEARALLDAYYECAEGLRERLGERLPTVSVVRFLPEEIRLYQKDNFIGTVLEDVGLPRPPSQDVDDFAAVIGDEGIPQMGGEVIFVTSYGPIGDTAYARVTGSTLWRNLEAVQEGRVYTVPDDTWMLGIGVGAANVVLDDLERYLMGEGAAAE